MQNKKIAILLIISFSVVVFGLAYLMVVKKMFRSSNPSNSGEGQLAELNKENCGFSSDAKVYEELYKEKDKKLCQCLSDKEKISACESFSNDTLAYDEALRRYDIKFCDTIEEVVRKESCRQMVENGLAEIKKQKAQNPEAQVLTQFEIEEKYADTAKADETLNLILNNAGTLRDESGKINQDKLMEYLTTLDGIKRYQRENSKVYWVEGFLYDLNLQNDEAIKSYSQSISLGTSEVGVYIGRANVYIKMNKISDAIVDLEKAKTLNANDERVIMGLCATYAKKEESEKARANCELLLESTDNEKKLQAKDILRSLK